MKIGYLSYRKNYYPYRRTIIDIVPENQYIGVSDGFSVLNGLARKVNQLTGRKIINPFNLNNIYHDFGMNNIDVLHLFNGISFSSKPWVSTFETIVPRLTSTLAIKNKNEDEKRPLSGINLTPFRVLANDLCKGILPISDNAYQAEEAILKNVPLYLSDKILSKMDTIHPPQPTIIRSMSEKDHLDFPKIRFLFVGSLFFQKGGWEILQAFDQLVNIESLPIELIIISAFRGDGYLGMESNAKREQALTIMNNNPDWITYYPSLPNVNVLKLMTSCHVGLLPTYGDTYGYTVLEFQAAGCPVITTNVRALPEINNQDCGWIIDLNKDPFGEAYVRTQEEKETQGNTIYSALTSIIRDIVNKSGQISIKGYQAYQRVRINHDPEKYAQRLKGIYENSLVRYRQS